MENQSPFVITIAGAESSGKTTLAQHLANALSCKWVPEYSREYLEKLSRSYEFADLERMARGMWANDPSYYISGELNPIKRKFPTFLSQGPNGLSDSTFSGFIEQLKFLKTEIIIVDGGMLTIKMWAQIKYGKTIAFVDDALHHDSTSLYLLCRPKREWEFDPLREAPAIVDRVWIYQQYLHYLAKHNAPFYTVDVDRKFMDSW